MANGKFLLVNDLILDENSGDLAIDATGDLVVGDAQYQCQKLVIKAIKRQFRNHIEVGVGIIYFLNDDSELIHLQHEIQKQLELDGYRVDLININGNIDLTVVAEKVR